MLDSLAASLAATLEASIWPGLAERAVLVLNHLLRSQSAASERLVMHAGKSIRIDWQAGEARWPKPPALHLLVTPAGLFETLPAGGAGIGALPSDGLHITVDLPSPPELARLLAQGARPATRIEGDTALAADVAWLADHLRWDVEHDLARALGDLPARTLVVWGQAVLTGVRGFVASVRPRKDGRDGKESGKEDGKDGPDGAGAAPPR